MQMTEDQIIKELKDILLFADPSKKDAVEGCTMASRLREDLGLSSIGILYIVIAIEETFHIRFKNAGMADFKVLGDVVGYIRREMQ